MQRMTFEDRATMLLAGVGIYGDGEVLKWILSSPEKNAERLALEKTCVEAIVKKDEGLFRERLNGLKARWSEWAREFDETYPPRKIERFKRYPEIVLK